MTVKNLPVGMFGAAMGLAGLGLSARAAATAWPGIFRAPAYFTELWVALGLLAFIALAAAYSWKVVFHPKAVLEEFRNPVTLGLCGALPVAMSLVAGGIGPYAPGAARILWWLSFAVMLAFQILGLARILSGGVALEQLNGGWLILLVGGIVLPGPGLALGLEEGARFTFGVSAVAAVPLTALLLYRALFGPPLPEPLRPTWFILLVPPSLIYANGLALYPAAEFLETLYFFGLALAAALLWAARRFLRWQFAAPWWAFTFPLDALAYAAARYAQDHPAPLWQGVSGATMVLATLFVALVLWKTLRSAASRAA
jgi:tellurite resistance protein